MFVFGGLWSFEDLFHVIGLLAMCFRSLLIVLWVDCVF